jgi:hypothetical protein
VTSSLRRLHRLAWVLLAIVLPLILIAGLAARRPEPGANRITAAALPLEAAP